MRPTILVSTFAVSALAQDVSWPFSFSESSVQLPPSLLFGRGPGDSNDSTMFENGIEKSTKELAASLWPISTPCQSNGSQEFCIYSNPKFANGRGISILTTPRRAASLAQSTAFADSSALQHIKRLNAPNHPKWKIRPVPGKDIGVVATQHFEVGDHIMSLTPALLEDYGVLRALSEHQILDLQAHGIDHLPADHRSIFLNLSTHDTVNSHVKRVDQVMHVNAYDIRHAGDVDDSATERGWFAVFPEISRINHDCRPNSDYYVDPATLTQHVHAVKHIMPGEEITVSYTNPVDTHRRRQKRIHAAWHFQCSCSLCTQNDGLIAASDARINQIEQLRTEMRDRSSTSLATPQMAELMVSLFEQENLWSMIYEAYTFAAVEHNSAGEPWLAIKYARLAVQHGLASGGPDDVDVVEMRSLARDPWSHWSWMMRTKKPLNWDSDDMN